MKYLLLYEELTKKIIKDEVNIIYQDNNLICLIPITQRASHIYGHNTNWCTTTKQTFNEIAEDGDKLLIRIIFKDGYKMRLSYDLETKIMDWSDKSSIHYFEKHSDDPFFITQKDLEDETINKNEILKFKIQNLFNRIESLPLKCRENIMYMINNKRKINYQFTDKEYISPKISKL